MEYVIKIDDNLISSVGTDFVESVMFEKELEALMLLRKQADYGSKNISACPVGPMNGVIVRLFDKISRLTNLSKNDRLPENEKLYDTTQDIANYGTIGSLLLKNKWPE